MEYSAPSLAILTLLIFGATTCSTLVFLDEPSLIMSEDPPGHLDVNYTRPCIQFDGQVQQFHTDVVVVQDDLSLCNMSMTDNQTLVRED